MKTLLTTLLSLAALSFTAAQQIDLSGQISIHNSRYRTGTIEYVADAFVQAPFAGGTSSDSEGKFSLTFQGIESGTSVSLQVEKAGLEVVNERELLYVTLGRATPLPVYLAPKGELAKRQSEFYEVSLATITTRHDALIDSMRMGEAISDQLIEALEQQLNREIANRYEAEDLLREQLEAAKERLPEMAQQLAQVNLDFASATYRQAYESYRDGDIAAALATLDEADLARQAEGIVAALASIEWDQQDYRLAIEQEEGKARQLYESYALKADAYELIFDYRSTVEVLQKGVELLEAVKAKDNLQLADAYGALGSSLQNLGSYPEALTAQRHSTLIKEKLLPDDDVWLATSYNNLASIYQDLGDYKEALAAQQKDIDIRAQASGQNDPKIAISYGNLALIYMNLGDYEKALNTQQQAINIMKEVFAPTDPRIATSYNNLAISYKYLGRYEKALVAQQENITLMSQLLSADDPKLATSFNNLASIYQNLGEYEKALQIQQEAIVSLEQVLEPNHPRLAASYNNLASIYQDLGEYEKALVAQQNAIAIEEQVLGSNHPAIASSYNNLALIYKNLEDYEKALAFQQENIIMVKRIFESNHPVIASSYNNLAGIYQDLGEYEKALVAQQEALAILEQVLAPDHPTIATSYNNLASIYKKLEDYEKALVIQQQAITILEQVLEPDHPTIAISYHNLSPLFYHQGQLDSALIYENKAYRIWHGKLPANHPYLEASKGALAFLYSERAMQKRITGLFQSAIADYEQALEFSPKKAELINQIGLAYYDAGKYKLAIENYEISYREQGVDQTVYLNNTGMAYARLGELVEARKQFTQLEEVLPANSLTYRAWGFYYTITGEPETALDNLEKAIELGYDNWEWLQTEKALDPLREHPRFQALMEQAPDNKE